MKAVRKRSKAPRKLTTRDGIALAIQLLRELRAADSRDKYGLDPRFRKGSPQENIVLRYLESIESSGSRQLKEGFARALSDFVGTCVAGAVTDADYYERFAK